MRRCASVALRAGGRAAAPQQLRGVGGSSYNPHVSQVQPLVRASKDEVEKYGAEASAMEDSAIKIGYLKPDGTVGEAQSLLMFQRSVKAEFNVATHRVEIVREDVGGPRLVAWVKGAQYMQSELESIEPLRNFWVVDEINARGGVMVMNDLGRIPGEAAKELDLQAAIDYIMKYDAQAPPGSIAGDAQKPAWFKEDEEMKAMQAQQAKRVRMITFGALAVVAMQVVYFCTEMFASPEEAAAPEVQQTRARAPPSLNK